ncbi:MAG: AI-2E family transporter, partial [Nevskiales bacterium]
MTDNSHHRPTPMAELTGWAAVGLFLLLIIKLKLLVALLSGLLVYEMTYVLVRLIRARWISTLGAKLLAITLVATIIVGLMVLLGFGIAVYLRDASVVELLQKMADIIEGSRNMLPPWLWTYLPGNADELRIALGDWLRQNAGLLQGAGTELGRALAHMLIGMVIGALLSLQEIAQPGAYPRPLTRALVERVTRLRTAFRNVVLAQVRIAAINATFTWLYLGVALPLLGVDLPLVKTMVAVTFVVGLLPVVGNLVSNTVIVIVSLSHSLLVAIASLAYLVVIHKLEYFLNARIIGGRIHAQAWELLLAMLMMVAAFGIPGLVAGPMYY